MIGQALAWLAEGLPAPAERTAWGIAQQVVAFIIALATLYGLVLRPIIKAVGKHVREAIAEVVEHQQQTNRTLARVDHQLHPNGGSSAHDYSRRAYEEAQAIRAEQRHQGRRLDQVQGELTAQGWRLQEVAEAQTQAGTHGREALVQLRESLAVHGIVLPRVPGETDPEEVTT